jgi:DNA-binding transcriptional ArsR family regulator
VDYETININDERAKELAQILTNEKAISILHLIEDRALSLSEIARELNLPISTVSYHIEKMIRVGLVEVAGKKYGKRLQEVKLYRASNRPILLVPRKTMPKIKKKTLSFERLHVISLGIAGLVSLVVYSTSSSVLRKAGVSTVYNVSFQASNASPKLEVMGNASRMPFLPSTTSSTSTSATSTPITQTASKAPSLLGYFHTPELAAIVAFLATFLAVYYILKRRY